METKVKALASILSVKPSEIEIDGDYLTYNGEEWLVLTDEEADIRAKDYILDSVWAFRPDFLAGYTELPVEVFEALQDKCEDANEAVLELIKRTDGGVDDFVDDAIGADGRGHFISTYDGDEQSVCLDNEWYFCYRTN